MFVLKIASLNDEQTIIFPDLYCESIICDVIDGLVKLQPDFFLSYTLMDDNGTFYIRRKDVENQSRQLQAIIPVFLMDLPACVALKN